MKKTLCSKVWMLLIHAACMAALLAVILPLLAVAQYDYPSADDWSYGVNAYHALQGGAV